MSLIITLIIALTIICIVIIISVSCVKYYSSESKRKIVTIEEKNLNLENLMRLKDSEYDNIIKNKEAECLRTTEIIKNLMEKQQNYNVNAKISD